MCAPADPPRRQRVAAYAVITRGTPDGEEILLSRLAPYLLPEGVTELWTLPGGGVEFGEDPRDAVVREVHEETGLHVRVGARALIDSARRFASVSQTDMHSVRIVFDGSVPGNSPQPHVVETDGSTIDARWHPLADVGLGKVPVVATVRTALAAHHRARLQRVGAYAVIRRDGDILLSRISRFGHRPGTWTLPGGGIDFGESPDVGVVREVFEETGLAVTLGPLLGVHDVAFIGTAPNGLHQDYHGIHIVYAGTVPADAEPHVVEIDGTTDAVGWVPVADIEGGSVPVLEVVQFGLAQHR